MRLTRRVFVAATSAASLHAAAVLNVEERKLLDMLCEQIIPSDEFAGATDAGVVNYIELQLQGPLKRFEKYYHAGLQALAATEFATLDADRQTEFLRRMEKGEIRNPEWKLQSAGSFFQMVVDHSMQGFYGDPKHGGNKDAVSWKMLGLGEHKHP